jgi:hypothetical protein
MDMMRPVSVNVRRALVPAPTLATTVTNNVVLTWNDATPVDYLAPSSWTNPGTAEVGYRVERAPGASGGTFTVIGNVLANKTTFTDTPNLSQTWRYRVTAWNAAGDSRSNIVTVAPVVVLRASTTTVTSSRNPSTYGQSVTFTATVRPATGLGVPTGTVQFRIDGVAVGGFRTLNASGIVTYTPNTLSAGTHTVTATYTGDGVFSTSTSPNLSQVVNKANTTTTVTSSLNPSTLANNPVTFTARVTPVGNIGTVQFRIDGVVVGGSRALDATGRATLSTILTVGTHTVQAVYSGSANYNTSTSTTLNQLVNP